MTNKLTGKNSPKYKNNKYSGVGIDSPNYKLYVIFAVICILPLIVRLVYYDTKLASFPWFPENGTYSDIFLYYKQRFFIILSSIMLIYIIAKAISDRKLIQNAIIFIPLAVYMFMVVLSTLFSKYISFSLSGSFELFESVFVLLGYGILAFYSYLILKTEKDFRAVYYFLITISLILSVMGVLQFLGYDFFAGTLGKKLVIPSEYNTDLNINFEKGRVYLTLYNPNMVGFLCSLLIPILFTMTLFEKKIVNIILSSLSIIGLSVCLLGSQSLTGIIGIALALICLLLFLYRYILKHYIISIIVIAVIIMGTLVFGKITNHVFLNKMREAVNITKTELPLSAIETKDDMVTVTYNGHKLNLQYNIDNNKLNLIIYDDSMNLIENTFVPEEMYYILNDPRFPGFVIGFDKEMAGVFYAQIDGVKWRFTNNTEDRSYYFINRFYKLDKINNPEALLFKGYENLASGRGYMWSRTIPLLKNYLFTGSGPDSFTMVFPHNDYIGLLYSGYYDNIITKPHNMYLQMGVQTGVLSLLAFLTFYIWYFISSVRIYIKGKFTSIYSKYGLAALIGSISYMVSGLAYDSSICVAPIFWTMIGFGIAANYKAKQLMNSEEVKLEKK